MGKRNFIDFGDDKLGLINGHYLMQWELGMDFAIATNRKPLFSTKLLLITCHFQLHFLLQF
jgi:hypothetical protein